MKLTTFFRIFRTALLKANLREQYWAVQYYRALFQRLFQRRNRTFARHVAKDFFNFLFESVHPIKGETLARAQASVTWLLKAQDSTPDKGVSLGYFPCDLNHASGWRPSYPEATGYIIPSLLRFAKRFKDQNVRERALQMAAWEIEVQMASGAVQGGPVCPPERQMPAVFNTGMVLHGFTAAYRTTKDPCFLEAGRRAADFLLRDIGEDGHFQTHGAFVNHHKIKTYNCLCAWPLYRFGEDTGERRYQEAAVMTVEAALGQQQANGWFSNNCLTHPETPLLHTISYTLQGIFEVGALAGREDFIGAVRKGAEQLLQRISAEGFLHGCFFADWEPAVFSSCLTGSGQLAVVYYRLYDQTRDSKYRIAADRLVNYLKALQVLDSENPALNGAIPGSFPLMGGYMTAGYPSWATKYFLDALLYQHRFTTRGVSDGTSLGAPK